MDSSSNLTLTIAKHTYHASRQLATAAITSRRQGIIALAKNLEARSDEILEANTLDLEMSREMAVSELMLDWLKLTPERLEMTVAILKQLAKSADLTGRLINAPYQLEPCQSYSQLMPLGTVALIYEAFPELALITTGMCLKTGNSLILRGCSTASNSNLAISQIIEEALAESNLPTQCIEVIFPDTGSSIEELIVQDRYINLIIPYGRPSFVNQIITKATAPVLPTAIGNCYLYWSASGDLDLTRHAIIDSHQGQPDAVNAIEKVLVQSNKAASSLVSLLTSLQEQGFQLRGEAKLCQEFPEYLQPIQASEWGKPYMNKIVSFRYSESLTEAIAWINRYSSGHANCLITESYQESRQFTQQINSALVYINTSPRFSRNPSCGEAIFLGMSHQKGHRQGLIGLETFTTLKQVVQG
ncbi:MAG TPA: glutamate-5-semialdehyde dehydrogenase [Xenococcaceae cyanobacterium]|jgi:glutamate-5-semialdehyde dehydrogenase